MLELQDLVHKMYAFIFFHHFPDSVDSKEPNISELTSSF